MKKETNHILLKGKTTEALIDLLKLVQAGKENINPDILNSIIDELYSRELTDKEKNEFENYLNHFVDEDEIADLKQLTTEDIEPNRYKVLKICIGYFSLLGYIVIFAGIVSLIFFNSDGKTLIGIMSIITSFVIALPLLAFSNLIQVFIDIELNTRNMVKKNM